jgi:hypothetical protein
MIYHGDLAVNSPDTRIQRYFQWYSMRIDDLPEDRILQELERREWGEFGSPQALYTQLANDGFPVCRVCGETPAPPGHCGKQPRRRQPDLGGGSRVKLPDASTARGLFRMALKELEFYISFVKSEESWLEGNIEEGKFKGKHFIRHSVSRDVLDTRRREEFTEEEWRELCEQHGTDPERDQIVLSRNDEAAPGGVSRAPSIFLVALIAAYELTHQPLTPLVERLHPDPESVDREKMMGKIDELHEAAAHLAILVRGGVVERGRGVEEISSEDHFAAWLIQALQEEGAASYEEVHERLKRPFPDIAERLTPTKISRIRHLHLEPPE